MTLDFETLEQIKKTKHSHIIYNFHYYLIDCEHFFLVNIPSDLQNILDFHEYDLMHSLAENYIADEFSYSF